MLPRVFVGKAVLFWVTYALLLWLPLVLLRVLWGLSARTQ
eukprot:SAG25_NODE_1133_length_3837_cov_10.869984_5_plen_40_part_00